ncbi:MAG: pseudouridine synthase [Candidatus Dormibacteria bacterium]
MSQERLNRYLARRGISSRRGADSLIAAGRVAVNGRSAAIGTVIEGDTDAVEVDGRSVPQATVVATVMLNKPLGVVTTVRNPGGRPTVMDFVERQPGLVPVGRLDADSRGLLLLSTDGDLVHRLTHPSVGVVKRYRVRSDRDLDENDLSALLAGAELHDGPARALRASRAGSSLRDIDIDLAEGRKREVRRLCAALAITVLDLQRVAFGPLRLGSLGDGATRALTAAESHALYAAAQLPNP